MEDIEKEVSVENCPKFYSHIFYCKNCGERNYRRIEKGKQLKTVAFECENCGCRVGGYNEEKEKIDYEVYDDFIGQSFFFRTVTYHLIGRVTKRIGFFLQLEETVWVADSGRFMQTIKEGTLDEYEEVGDAFVNLESVTDFFPWLHKLPKGQK